MTDYGQLSDVELIDACRAGKEGAWEAIVSRYERLVYTVPARYGLTSAEIDDVFQSVWLSLLRNLNKLREPDRVSAWLVTTARRECWERRRGADYERTVNTDLDIVLADKEGEDLPPDEVVARFNQHEALRTSIEQLQDRCRRLLWLLYYDSNIPSYADVAEKLDMPIGSIGPMRARCLKKLRAIMTGLLPDQ
jgi:RNA polymerase sigma factor (sigma-70 family)